MHATLLGEVREEEEKTPDNLTRFPGSNSVSGTSHDGTVDLVRPNERNEFDVAEGISASCFRVVMVRQLSIN